MNPFYISEFLTISSDNIDIQDNIDNPVSTTNILYNMLFPTFAEKKNEILHRLNTREFLKYHCGLITRYDGGRATSNFCSLPSKKNKHKKDPRWYREDYLDDFFGKNNWEDYDVPSSIPQVFHLLNRGFWLGERVYNMTSNPETFKKYVMRLMFNKTDKQAARAIMLMETNNLHSQKGEKKEKYYSHKVDPNLVKLAGDMKAELESIIGPTTIGADIFIHESNIYLLVCEELMNRGLDFLQCYDGFYFRKGEKPVDMEDIIKNKAEEYLRRYYGKENY